MSSKQLLISRLYRIQLFVNSELTVEQLTTFFNDMTYIKLCNGVDFVLGKLWQKGATLPSIGAVAGVRIAQRKEVSAVVRCPLAWSGIINDFVKGFRCSYLIYCCVMYLLRCVLTVLNTYCDLLSYKATFWILVVMLN